MLGSQAQLTNKKDKL